MVWSAAALASTKQMAARCCDQSMPLEYQITAQRQDSIRCWPVWVTYANTIVYQQRRS